MWVIRFLFNTKIGSKKPTFKFIRYFTFFIDNELSDASYGQKKGFNKQVWN